ncbi:hypothetical protein [Magnetococcus marinus]|uniref:hypothetical protein n=1 Tax=Magnetococcus marinus TaxID=1124597 RepID=UPI0000381319|nr:hypothetical protein [Magnetococcus marinus]
MIYVALIIIGYLLFWAGQVIFMLYTIAALALVLYLWWKARQRWKAAQRNLRR